MKNLIFSLIFVSSISTFSYAGNEGPNGGDPISQEFVSLARGIHSTLVERGDRSQMQDLRLDLVKLLEIINSQSRVYTQPKVFLSDGTEVGAINYLRRMRIIVGSDRWKSYTLSQKLGLVLHEYLGLMEIEINLYEISIEFIEILDITKQSIIENRAQFLRYYAQSTVARPLYETEVSCDLNAPFVQRAKREARLLAIQSCQVDTQRTCEHMSYNIRVVPANAERVSLTCLIEAVAKLEE